MKRQRVNVDESGRIQDLEVVGYHGEVFDDETPARCGPVYATADHHLARIVTVGSGEAYLDVDGAILEPEGPLPGVGTRCGPWPARVDNVLLVLGSTERKDAHRMLMMRRPKDPPIVKRYLAWLADGGNRSSGLTCEVQGDLATWYCTEAEGFALFERIHRVAEDEFFCAIGDSRDALVAASWRLSRAAISDQDIYLAAVGLRRAASPDWKALREVLPANERDGWDAGIANAEHLLQHPPRLRAPMAPIVSTRFRDGMRRSSLVKIPGEEMAA